MNNLQRLSLKLEENGNMLKEASDALFYLKDSVTEDETGSNALFAIVRILNNIQESYADIQKDISHLSDIPNKITGTNTRLYNVKLDTEYVSKALLDEIYEDYAEIESVLFYDKEHL